MMTSKEGGANLEFTGRLGPNKFYVRKIGYKPEELVYNGVGVDSPDTVVTVYLERVTTLPTSVTTANKLESSFYFRAKMGMGKFLTPEELKQSKYDHETVGEAIEILGKPASHRGAYCYSRVLVDGTEWRGPGTLMNDPIRRFVAVEFYPSSGRTPIEFEKGGSGASCGVWVFWSRLPG
jgi:hypothetical protein